MPPLKVTPGVAATPASVMAMRALPVPTAPPSSPVAVMREVPAVEDAGMVTVTASLSASLVSVSASADSVIVAMRAALAMPVKVSVLPVRLRPVPAVSASEYSALLAKPATAMGTTRVSPLSSARPRVTVKTAVALLSPSVAVVSVAARVTEVGSLSVTSTETVLVAPTV